MKSPRFELVRNAVGRWITEEEASEILGETVAPPADKSTLTSRVSDVEEAVNTIIGGTGHA